MGLFLGLDVGTQSTKAVVYDEHSKSIVARASVSYGVDSERPGQAEQHPQVWIDACKGAIKEALQLCDASKVTCMSVAGQQHGLTLLDAQKAVIRPSKLWCDLESDAEAKELSKLFQTTIVPSFTITKLLWVKHHEPENYARISYVCLPHDYINLFLTGAHTMEASDASGTGIFDDSRREWDKSRIDLVDPIIAEWLPQRVLNPDEAAGVLLPDVAAELGLPLGVVVGPGGGDNAMSALGCGAIEEGTWVVSLGTSGTLFGPSMQPLVDTSGAICAFCDATGQALPLLCTVGCTGSTEEVLHLMNSDHTTLSTLAEAEPPGSCGVTTLPYLQGERTPNWPHASGAVLGLRPGLLRPGILYRSAMEGASFSLLRGLHLMKEMGVQAKELRVVGGGSKSGLWRRIICDAFQLPLLFPVEPDAAALGASLQAGAIASGTPLLDFLKAHAPKMEEESLQPDASTAAAYEEAYQRFVNQGEALFGRV